jgi:hypothetical protein
MLILLFGVKPSTAISSDLVATVVMRPIGADDAIAHAQRHQGVGDPAGALVETTPADNL